MLGAAPTVAGCVVGATSASGLFFGVLDQLSGHDRLAWCMTLWSLWSCRNQLVWNNSRDMVAAIVLRGSQLLSDWMSARDFPLGASIANSVPVVCGAQLSWQKTPWAPMGFVKCNVDAAFDSGGNKVGFSLCLRDENYPKIKY